MSSRFILFGLVVVTAFTSCSIYKSGQTPDDVYYSPAREVAAGDSYLSMDDNNRNRNYRSDDYSYSSYDDYWLRMRVRNPYRWSTFYDYDMYGGNPYMMPYGYYNPYMYGGYANYYGFGFTSNYWNNYYYWNSFYNPYNHYIVIGGGSKGGNTPYNTVRNLNMNTYRSPAGYNNLNNQQSLRSTRPSYQYNNSNVGGRRVTTGGRDSYYAPSNDRPVRAYTPPAQTYTPARTYSGGSTGSAGSSGSSGGGGGTGSRPVRN